MFRLFTKSSQGTNSQAALGYLLTSVTLCSLAMLFKEQGITVLGLCCAYDIVMFCKIDFIQLIKKLFKPKKPASTTEDNGVFLFRGLIFRQSILVLVGIILLLGRWKVMGSTPPHFQVSDNPPSFEKSFVSRFINYNYIYTINLWLLINPWWLCFDWSMGCIPLIKEPTDPRVAAVLLMWAVLFTLFGYCILGQPSHYKRICTMGLAFLIVPFLPASNIFFRVGFVIAERVLYLSSVGSCILVVLGIAALSRRAYLRKYVACCMFTMIVCFTLWTIKVS
ncbi:protein O-mannosyl-transferase TMTC4-like [Actinia tenebrosa]|uniref:Protein O-mannosyl-transferase TMTC4-like n=1 Tax=Actinia tenebrosa TaxID=6105 RepID=A0A6P8HR66_ACTTE|nr:protein O-mannosyl-transferase TMTC4-like [Actinia tenebrosa]